MNRKLTLDLDALAVTSFRTGTSAEALGTVNAHEAKQPCRWSEPFSCPATLHTCASFDVSCREEG
ncbi:hypothetical protein [Longimicrobium sp.]|uniref:hypothetical protein n=1 Tax=Longimicrobium sp. TaxID=2029185 RepID=UPI002C614553|nr:hypothetical protein [Longimicrobium sp.]HSU16368.1 hypothetical protein [Longimicrobium sp.]